VIPTPEFKKIINKLKKNKELLDALDKKIPRLQENPHVVGGMLSGDLHGLCSTRLIRVFRLIFRIKEESKIVELVGIDDRGHAYG